MQSSPFSRQLDDLDGLDRVDRYAFFFSTMTYNRFISNLVNLIQVVYIFNGIDKPRLFATYLIIFPRLRV